MANELRDVEKIVGLIKDYEISNCLNSNNNVSLIWKSFRSELYYNIQKDLGVFEAVKPNSSKLNKIKTIFRVLKNSIFNRPKTIRPIRNFVFLHPRSIKVGSSIIDPYADYNLGQDCIYLYRSSIGELPKKSTDHRIASVDFLVVKTFYYGFLNKRSIVKSDDYIKLTILVSRLVSKLKLDSKKYYKMVFKRYVEFVVYERYYCDFLKNNDVKKVYLVDHYSKNVPLIAASKKNRIPSFEYQHGIISDYHLGYACADSDLDWPGYPDVFISWGRQWVQKQVFPKNVRMQKTEPKYLNRVDLRKKRKQLLIVSQSVNGAQIAEVVKNHVDFNFFDRIVFKLHPSENDRIEFYRSLFDKYPVEISFENIYECLNDSSDVLGVFSTALLEAIDFKCRVFYISLPGSEYLKSVVDVQDFSKAVFYVK